MIFETIRITNLYSYYGEQEFRLPTPTPERPVVLIAGRNGFGKTSFINSVKLLFLGTADEMLKGVQAGLNLRPNTFLLGLDREWQGIFNHRARLENLPNTRYGVAITWREDQGQVIAQRYWTLRGSEAESHLCIETDFETDFGKLIEDPEAAEEFLERRLPKNVVPFFFYDGEKVQQIAEANREGQLRQIERLLDLAAIDTLNEYLQKAVTDWKRDGLAAETLAALEELRAKEKVQAARRAALQAQHDDLAADIENLDRDIRRNERQRDAIRAKSLQRDEPQLREKLKTSQAGYEQACQKVGATLPVAAPLWAAPQLLNQVGQMLSAAMANPGHLLADEIKGILARLPERLLDEPPHAMPPLSDSQKTYYKRKLAAIFSQYTDPPSGGFFSLNPAETAALKRRMDYFLQAGGERKRIADDLRLASRMRREMLDAQAALDSLDNVSPEEQRAARDRQEAIVNAQKKRDDLLKNQGAIAGEINQIDGDGQKLTREIKEQETRQVKTSINSRRIDRARQAQRVFEAYKQQVKQTRREQIEAAINHRFKSLMTSHGQINRFKVDDDFALTYLDADGEPVGMANISAGMKQLTAQALLWALSEATSRHVPIIVDTPLARIDRQHQENLLTHYYPHAGQQVIVLPTDSELDREKYHLLAPHIIAEFRLENTTGDHTEVRSGVRMYDVEAV